MRSLVCLPICLVLFLLCLTAETRLPSPNCCLKTNNCRIPEHKVVGYRVQKAGVCQINAIILWTKRGKGMCCDPDSEWTKNITRMVDLKKLPKQNSDPKASPSQKRKNRKGHKQKKKI
ncbi:C-C motif chemokine 32b.3 [Pseudorasbora parva]|uniref:C-C motif chemokine 32b.3 n=1 Tax=Pseudorasbora parva TaxID=51549 RepID=UPI00351F213C